MNANKTLPWGKILPQLTKEQAIKLAKSKAWEKWSDDKIVGFQLYQDKLAVPFDRFHAAIEKVLDRSVWTHEFAQVDKLRLEYEGLRHKPDFNEIMGQIPKEKRIFILAPENHDSPV